MNLWMILKKMTNLFNNSESKKENAINMALKYLSYRSRTIFETQTYLKKNRIDADTIDSTISFLMEKDFLNDTRYCHLYLEYHAEFKPKSCFAFTHELKRRGIPAIVIEDVLSRYEDDKLALKAVERKIIQWKKLDPDTLRKKMMNFLRYRGFSYDICISTYSLMINDGG